MRTEPFELLRLFLAVMFAAVLFSGCAGRPGPGGDEGLSADPRSLTHIDETRRVKVGMHESEVIRILGPPVGREEGFYSGTRLWFKLYNPKYDTIPTNFLISTDRYGYVTFISNGG